MRRIRSLFLAASAFVLIATAAQAQAQIPPSPLPNPGKPAPAPTDKGNNASQSVGVVQVGPVTVDPTSAVADTPVTATVANVSGTTEATVGTPGTGNGASQSGGVVQVGGGNTATGSAGAAQVSHSNSQTAAHAQRGDSVAQASAPTSDGGSGTNSANGSVAAAQVGSGQSSGGSTGAVQIQPSTAGVAVTGKAGPAAPDAGLAVSASGEQVLGDLLGVSLSELGTYPGSGTAYVLNLVQRLMPQILPPGVSPAIGLQQLIDSGTITIGEQGDDARIDVGTMTMQVVSLNREPSMTVGLMGTELSVDAPAGVPNNGEPSTSNSTGVVQAGGGGNSADSVGVVQVGSLALAPSTKLKSDELGASAALDGGAGVPSGNNSVDPSAGVVQVGGVLATPSLTAGADGVGSASTGSSGGIAGGDNTANNSSGVVQ